MAFDLPQKPTNIEVIPFHLGITTRILEKRLSETPNVKERRPSLFLAGAAVPNSTARASLKPFQIFDRNSSTYTSKILQFDSHKETLARLKEMVKLKFDENYFPKDLSHSSTQSKKMRSKRRSKNRTSKDVSLKNPQIFQKKNSKSVKFGKGSFLEILSSSNGMLNELVNPRDPEIRQKRFQKLVDLQTQTSFTIDPFIQKGRTLDYEKMLDRL